MPPRPHADLRIGDPEREQAIRLLGEHMAARRIDLAEYDERCSRAVSARTGSELQVLFEDLPDPRPVTITTSHRPVRRGRRIAMTVCLIAVLALAAVTLRQFWLLAVIAVVGLLWWSRQRP